MDTFDPAGLASDPERLREALRGADPATLMLVLVHLTGNAAWLDRARPYIVGPSSYQETMPEALRAEIREALFECLLDLARSGRSLPPMPRGDLLREMLEVAAGQSVADDYLAMVSEDLEVDSRDDRGMVWRHDLLPNPAPGFHVVIIGAGMSGLCAAIRLREAGLAFTIIEKNPTVGGTWFENSYPGCGVDTPNHFYSYSFEPKTDWSHFFSKRDELWRYFEDVAQRHDLRSDILFETEATEASFDEAAGLWRVTARRADGERIELEANVLISGVGILNRPKIPEIPGQDTFQGPAFHTAQWDHSVDLAGKRVVMIGTGASGHQVGPSIAPTVGQLTIFQRSPHWIVPNPNYFGEVSDGKKWVLAHVPYYGRWYRFQLFWAFADGIYSALQVDPDWHDPGRSINAVNNRHRLFMERYAMSELGPDSSLLDKVIPGYPPYGKRILIDNHWYRMLKRRTVSLVTEPVDHIEANAVVAKDGTSWPADVIVYATGFLASKVLSPMVIKGVGGKEIHDAWGPDDAKAYLGVAVPGFPNFFMMMGPNTGLAHGGNAIFMTECQVRYMMLCIREIIETGAKSLDVRPEVYEDYNAQVDAMHERLVWTHKGLTNWYRNPNGRVFALSPWRLVDYWKMTSTFEPGDFTCA